MACFAVKPNPAGLCALPWLGLTVLSSRLMLRAQNSNAFDQTLLQQTLFTRGADSELSWATCGGHSESWVTATIGWHPDGVRESRCGLFSLALTLQAILLVLKSSFVGLGME